MKTRTLGYGTVVLLMATCLFLVSSHARAQTQCYYIPSTSQSTDTLSYSFVGGSFESFGCAPIDPTFWLEGSGISVTVTFVDPQLYPTFRVWGMNDDDTASVSVQGVHYPLTASTASYAPKVVCGVSPGPDGILFSGGNIVGANTNPESNYSYQDVQLHTTNVSTFTVAGISGDGWGFAGVLVNCPLMTGIDELEEGLPSHYFLGQNYPNPFNPSTTIEYALPTAGFVTLKIYDMLGEEVATLVEAEKPAGQYKAEWQAQTRPSGVYFYRLAANGFTETRRLILLR